MEITENTLRVGIVGVDATPKHIVPLQSVTPSFFQSEPALQDPASVWYRYLAPILKSAYQRLIGFGAKERKAIVLFRGYDDKSLPRSIEDAILAVLIAEVGVPAVNLQCSALSMVPYSLPMLSHMLVVSVGIEEASCQVHASGENLPFTYQSVPLQSQTSTKDDATTSFQSTYMDLNNPNSVLMAMVKTLEACPRTVRKFVVSNIVFCGTGLCKQPHIPVAIVKQLKLALTAASSQSTSSSTRSETNPAMDLPQGDDDELVGNLQTLVPVSLKSLAGLESHVGLVKCNIRPDLLAWVGATQWAAHWHGQDPSLQKWKWHTEWPSKS
uniref:Uncharacterized protein n=1 Tax=Entomoneis paludosa TaxID=265537 RepID=A0A7S2YMK8_9STRA